MPGLSRRFPQPRGQPPPCRRLTNIAQALLHHDWDPLGTVKLADLMKGDFAVAWCTPKENLNNPRAGHFQITTQRAS